MPTVGISVSFQYNSINQVLKSLMMIIVLSMELVPPNIEKMTKFTEDINIPTKKAKVQVRACQTLIFLLRYSKK